MTNNQLTDERVTSVIERLEHYACNLKWTNVRGAQDLLTAADGLRELQERRKADSEPVAEVYQAPNVGICAALGPSIRMLCPLEPGTKLYHHAQPAPVVQCPFPCGWDNLNKLAIQDAALVARGLVEDELTTEAHRQAAISNNDRLLKIISACRAAMLQSGNSPVIPEGYVMVPKEPTDEMIAAAMNCDDVLFNSDESFCVQFGNIYEAMLAAAPHDTPALNSVQSVVTGSDTWIQVSERMPIEFEAVIAFDGDQVYGEAMYSSDDGFTIDGYDPCDRLNLQNVTHWMPLPAAPQEVK